MMESAKRPNVLYNKQSITQVKIRLSRYGYYLDVIPFGVKKESSVFILDKYRAAVGQKTVDVIALSFITLKW